MYKKENEALKKQLELYDDDQEDRQREQEGRGEETMRAARESMWVESVRQPDVLEVKFLRHSVFFLLLFSSCLF